MPLNLLSYDEKTRTGLIHDTEHELDRDYFYAFDAGDSAHLDALAPDVSLMLIPPFGKNHGMSVMVANAYRISRL